MKSSPGEAHSMPDSPISDGESGPARSIASSTKTTDPDARRRRGAGFDHDHPRHHDHQRRSGEPRARISDVDRDIQWVSMEETNDHSSIPQAAVDATKRGQPPGSAISPLDGVEAIRPWPSKRALVHPARRRPGPQRRAVPRLLPRRKRLGTQPARVAPWPTDQPQAGRRNQCRRGTRGRPGTSHRGLHRPVWQDAYRRSRPSCSAGPRRPPDLSHRRPRTPTGLMVPYV